MVTSYNYYLHEYQHKFGNELMKELEINLKLGTVELSINTENMKILFNNFSIIKELELINVSKQKKLDFNNQEIKRLEISNEELTTNNTKLYNEIQKYKDNSNDMLTSYLNKGGGLAKTQGAFGKDEDIESGLLKERKQEVQRLLKENEILMEINKKMKGENEEVNRICQ